MKVDCGLQSLSFSDDHSGGEEEDDFHMDSTSNNVKTERKSNKPIMEKRRRARINSCLNELKGILLEAMRKDPARHSKLEKADILELTVRHLQNVQRNQLAVAMASDPTVLHRFKNGFAECSTEVNRYLGRLEGVDGGIKQRLTGHLGACVSGLQQVGPMAFGPPRYTPLSGIPFSVPQSPLPIPMQPNTQQQSPPSATVPGSLPPGLPHGGDMNNNRYSLNSTPSSTVTSSAFDGSRGSRGFVQRRPPTPPPSPPIMPGRPEIEISNNEKATNTTPLFTIGSGGGGAPLDFSKNKATGDKVKLDVRIGKVEPMVKAEADSSGGSRDSMWRPW